MTGENTKRFKICQKRSHPSKTFGKVANKVTGKRIIQFIMSSVGSKNIGFL